MTAALRTLAFADLDAPSWGAAWLPGPAQEAVIALGAAGDDTLVSGGPVLSVGEEEGEWRLRSDRAELVVAPASQVVEVQTPEREIAGWDQLCRVSGRFGTDGQEHAVDCLGLRGSWSAAVELDRFEAVRAVSVWFDPDEAFALTAFRPHKAKAHAADVVAAAVIAAGASVAVEDPRLSTTYEGEGWPVRAGLELWLAATDDSESERPYPRRASGEAIGARAQALTGQLDVRAEPFRWHSRGRDGAGLYLLARRR
jgi:hypothetical protein